MEHICYLVLLTAILIQAGCSAPIRPQAKHFTKASNEENFATSKATRGNTHVPTCKPLCHRPVVRVELTVALGDRGARLLHRQQCPASPRQGLPLHWAPQFGNALQRSWQPLNWKEKGLIISSTTSAVTRTSDPFPVTLHLLWMFYTGKGQSLHN